VSSSEVSRVSVVVLVPVLVLVLLPLVLLPLPLPRHLVQQSEVEEQRVACTQGGGDGLAPVRGRSNSRCSLPRRFRRRGGRPAGTVVRSGPEGGAWLGLGSVVRVRARVRVSGQGEGKGKG